MINEQWPKGFIIDNQTIVKIPLQFYFQPVEILTKQLTKLNSTSPFRIHYMGPRWDNSLILHKKYGNKGGYQFDEKVVTKNNYLSVKYAVMQDAMFHNQFYKNEIYYRAFEGINPTINKQQQLWFESRFESGNLDCVVKIGPQQYDLFLRIDSNTRGHLFWFYFEISNCKVGTIVKLNICNISKCIGLYKQGFKPFCSVRDESLGFKEWTQESCFDVSVGQKKLRYEFIYQKIKVRKLVQLSFKYKFQSNEPVRFAYCIPYTYTQMVNEIHYFKSKQPHFTKIGSLGKSLTGVDVPYLMVGRSSEERYRQQQAPVLLCIARLHPGESNGSHVLSGLMSYVCTANQAAYIRQKIITVFIPIINPDGVIMGNSRTNATGRDLNREFKTKNKAVLPEIYNLKLLCHRISLSNTIQMFLDFHGHSKKKNMFCFGPNYNVTQVQYYRARVFPKFLSQLTPIFRYFGCDYSIPPTKSTTARAFMLEEQSIPYVYAIETSIGQYFDYEAHKLVPFYLKKWLELGGDVGRALKQYFESIHQFRDYIRLKTQDSQGSIECNRNNTHQKNEKQKVLKIPLIRQNNTIERNNNNNVIKDVKLIKIFDQIKVFEEEYKYLNRNIQQLSNNDTDSDNQDDHLQWKKRSQFQNMINECIITEEKKKQNKLKKLQESQSLVLMSIPSKKRQKKYEKHHIKLQSDIMKKMMKNINGVMDDSYQGNVNRNALKSRIKKQLLTQNIKEKEMSNRDEQNIKTTSRTVYEQLVTKNVCFMETLYDKMNKKIKIKHENLNNWNMKMFNYSQAIQQISNNSISNKNGRALNKYPKKYKQTDQINLSIHNKQGDTLLCQRFSQIIQPQTMCIQCQSKKKEVGNQNDLDSDKESEKKKLKGVFPPSFYRIKFQNYQKKKQKKAMFQKIEPINQQSKQQINSIHGKNKKQLKFLSIQKVDKF